MYRNATNENLTYRAVQGNAHARAELSRRLRQAIAAVATYRQLTRNEQIAVQGLLNLRR